MEPYLIREVNVNANAVDISEETVNANAVDAFISVLGRILWGLPTV